MKHRQISITLITALIAALGAQAQTFQTAPRLVVAITIDQLRADYMEAFAPLYGDKGFKKLLSEGLVYANASYSFTPQDMASAIAALQTGTTPYYNSIVSSRWFDKEILRPVSCVDDDKQTGYQTSDKSSPHHLATSTIGDELKVYTSGKAIVYAVAPFREAAVLSAGHAANGAIWIDDNTGRWCSTNYYLRGKTTWLSAVNSLLSPSSFIQGLEWQAVNPLAGNISYFMSRGMQKPFRHKFTGPACYREYKTSGLVNEHVTDIAVNCIKGNGMGMDPITDMLSITYYAGTFDHRPLAESQMEIQDTYVRLDKEIERIVSSVEQIVGQDNALFVITSTGYFDEESIDYAKYDVPVGTFYYNRTANLLNMYFGALWGQGAYIEACYGREIFLNHKLLEQKKVGLNEATYKAQEFLCQLSGVRNVYTSQQLLLNIQQQTYKIRNGFHPERNGDIIIEVAPGWTQLNEETGTSQTSRLSFMPFPIVFYGAGVKAGRVNDRVSVERIAPTLAKSIRIRAPNACVEEPLF